MPRCLICGADHAVCTGPFGPQKLNYAPVGAQWEIGTMPKVNGPYTATERLYLDRDGKVVKEDDPNRASLLIAPGQTMEGDRAVELGLMDAESGEAVGVAAADAAPQPTATASKAKSAPAENKAVSGPKEDK